MNIELSLTQIGLVLLVMLGLPDIWRARKKLIRNKAALITAAFVVWNIISLFWTTNLSRGILTVGLVGLLWLAFLWVMAKKDRDLIKKFLRVMIWGGVGVGVFVIWQMIGGAIGVSSSLTTLCETCGADIFGFVKPNGFAIEPQFLGSLFLAPIFILGIQLINGKGSRREWLVFSFLCLALFLTMSRGAIYAFGVGMIALCVIKWRSWRKILVGVGAVIITFGVSLIIQGVTTQINPRVSDNFLDGTAKVLHQMSMGIIDLRPSRAESDDQAAIDGYVEESTDIRLSLSEMSIETILGSPKNFITGVGVGGTGVYFSEQFGTKQKEITQNQYLEVWVELGVIGVIIFGASLIGWLYKTSVYRELWSILVAYCTQWCFLSGYPNVLHIYLVLGIIWAIADSKTMTDMVKL